VILAFIASSSRRPAVVDKKESKDGSGTWLPSVVALCPSVRRALSSSIVVVVIKRIAFTVGIFRRFACFFHTP